MSPPARVSRDQYFERLPVPLWAVDAEDRTTDVNPAVVEALGYPVEELLGRRPADFLTDDSRATYRAQAILRQAGVADTFTATFQDRAGALRTFRVSGVPLYEGERYVGKIAVLRDLAMWNAVEDAMREANQELLEGLRARWSEASDVAHDLRNSLQAVLGFQDLIARDPAGALSEAQRTHLAMLESSAREALRLVEGLDPRGRRDASSPGTTGGARVPRQED